MKITSLSDCFKNTSMNLSLQIATVRPAAQVSLQRKMAVKKVHMTTYCATGIFHYTFVWILNTYISQGSVARCLRCGGAFNDCFVANILESAAEKEFSELINTWCRCGQCASRWTSKSNSHRPTEQRDSQLASHGPAGWTGWWHSVVVSGVGFINEVKRHWARLVLAWVTVCGWVNYFGM